MMQHHDRTDVTWKPLRQVKEGDFIYGPGMDVSKIWRVSRVKRLEGFRTYLEFSDRNSTFEGYDSDAVAFPKEDTLQQHCFEKCFLLHRTLIDNFNNETLADECRDEMDLYWGKLTPEQHEVLGKQANEYMKRTQGDV